MRHWNIKGQEIKPRGVPLVYYTVLLSKKHPQLLSGIQKIIVSYSDI